MRRFQAILCVVVLLAISLGAPPLASPTAEAVDLPSQSRRVFGDAASPTQLVRFGDVDGDGDLDIIGANLTAGGAIYLNGGDGTFDAERRFGTPGESLVHVVPGDFDGDGDLDIAAAVRGGQDRVYLNDGTGQFYAGPATCLASAGVSCVGPADGQTWELAAGDLDRDGDLDLAAVYAIQRPPAIFVNDGRGAFSGGIALPVGFPVLPNGAATSLAIGDLNGDGALDIVLGNISVLADLYLLNRGDGTFGPPLTLGLYADNTVSVALGDLNGDGLLDVVAGNLGQPRAYLNSGTGFGAPIQFGTGLETSDIALGDYDADGDLDVAAAGYKQYSQLYYNDGQGQLFPWPTTIVGTVSNAQSVALGDVDANGYLDLAVGNQGQQSTVYLNAGAPSTMWTEASPFGNGAERTFSTLLAPIDGDDQPDLVVGNQGVNYVYLNTGGAYHVGPVECGVTPRVLCFGDDRVVTTALAAGDLDADGDTDLVIGSSGQPAIYLNVGGQYHRGPLVCGSTPGVICFGTPGVFGAIQGLALGRIDPGPTLDIVAGIEGGQNVVFFNGGGAFHTGTIVCGSTPGVSCFGNGSDLTRGVALGDVDGDGDQDVVVANYNGVSSAVLNDGAGGFAYGQIACDQTTRVRCLTTIAFLATDVAVGLVDGDAFPDVVLATNGQEQVFFNDGLGAFTGGLSVAGAVNDTTYATALLDADNDGDGDIVAGNVGQSYLYLNDGGRTFSTAPVTCGATAQVICLGGATGEVRSASAGDIDGDGRADVALGRLGQQSSVYYNDPAGQPFGRSRGVGAGGDLTADVAPGDVNGDGAIDLLIANNGQRSSVALNRGDGGFASPRPFGSPTRVKALASALADVNGDGALDALLIELGGPSLVYLNQGGGAFHDGEVECGLTPGVRCFGAATDSFFDLATGDFDGDGSVDIAVASLGGQSRIFLNGGEGGFTARSVGPANGLYSEIATGDLDRDGDLDLAMGALGGQSAVFLNDGGAGFATGTPDCADARVRCVGGAGPQLRALVLGDADGDGNLDLAIANEGRETALYLNRGGRFVNSPPNCTDPLVRCVGVAFAGSQGLAFGDADGDGDQDLAIANFSQPGGIFVNDGAGNYVTGRPVGTGYDISNVVALADVNGDGAADLVVGNQSQQSQVFLNGRNRRPRHGNTAPTVVAYPPGGDRAAGQGTMAAVITDTLLPIRYRLYDAEGDPVTQVTVTFSPDGGGHWLPAVPAPGTPTVNLAASAEGVEHTFVWDTFASGVFGQFHSMVVRVTIGAGPRVAAYASAGSYSYTDGVPGPYQQAVIAAQTPPFRLRGTQVLVRDAEGAPAPGALVYRLPAEQARDARPFSAAEGAPFRTDAQGFLQGRGQLGLNDTLFALMPVTATEEIALYYGSAEPVDAGLAGTAVREAGVQALTVAPERPLALLNLAVGLEWDARGDPQYLQQLEADLKRASELLFRWSGGQIALGEVTVYQARERWNDVHIRVYASNRMRPNAVKGGIVARGVELVDPGNAAITYTAGQVRLGPAWSRYGDAGANLGEDWPRALAHELGHFALFLDDNYLGLDDAGTLITVEGCRGAMSDPYRDDYGALHPTDDEWRAACAMTLSQRTTGRSDWATVKAFYDNLAPGFQLRAPAQFGAPPTPALLPLAVTRVRVVDPAEPSRALEAPIFLLTDEGGKRLFPSADARAFLFQGDRLVDLGAPTLDQVLARGARVARGDLTADRLCVYDLARTGQPRIGCRPVTAGDQQLSLAARDWRPAIAVTPETSTTLRLTVSGIALEPGRQLFARLYPAGADAPAPIALAPGGEAYSGTLVSDPEAPAFEGFIHVWVDEPDGGARREAVVDFLLGGNPGGRWRRTAPRGNPGGRWRRTAPVLSADGQALLFGRDVTADEGRFFAIQAAVGAPEPPAWATPVGRVYRLTASPGVDLEGTSLSIGYLGTDTAPADEPYIGMYYRADGGSSWQLLTTNLDQARNEASAAVRGPGLYMLMSSLPIPLSGPGWNLFAYPAADERPVGAGLASIAGAYSVVYGYDEQRPADPWRVYAPGAPGWVNDLAALRQGEGYWIHMTRDVTLYLRRVAEPTATTATTGPSAPPATFYGRAPAGALTVEARVNGVLCGQAVAARRELGGQSANTYVIKVRAVSADEACGTLGAPVQLRFLDGARVFDTQIVRWDNREVRLAGGSTLFLPLVSAALTNPPAAAGQHP